MSPIWISIIASVASAVISGGGVHLWHTGGKKAPATPAPSSDIVPAPAPAPTPAPADGILFPNHPIASKALQVLLQEAELAGVAAAKAVLAQGAQAAAPALSAAK